jgi:hypothetical protein
MGNPRALRDSNPHPVDYESTALTFELKARMDGDGAVAGENILPNEV